MINRKQGNKIACTHYGIQYRWYKLKHLENVDDNLHSCGNLVLSKINWITGNQLCRDVLSSQPPVSFGVDGVKSLNTKIILSWIEYLVRREAQHQIWCQ